MFQPSCGYGGCRPGPDRYLLAESVFTRRKPAGPEQTWGRDERRPCSSSRTPSPSCWTNLLGSAVSRQHPALLQLPVEQGLHAVALPVAAQALQALQVLTFLGHQPLWARQKTAACGERGRGQKIPPHLPRPSIIFLVLRAKIGR